MPTLFTKIIERKIPAYIIAEDTQYIAFLDIAPITYGHTLVVPKKEIDYLFDLDDITLGKLMIFSKKIATSLEKTIACKRIGIAVLGLEVPHAHIHLIPIQKEKDLNLSNPKLAPLSHKRLVELTEQLQKAIKI